MGMSLTGKDSRMFRSDVLRMESISPPQPNLADDGSSSWEFRAADENQSDEDMTLVQNLC